MSKKDEPKLGWKRYEEVKGKWGEPTVAHHTIDFSKFDAWLTKVYAAEVAAMLGKSVHITPADDSIVIEEVSEADMAKIEGDFSKIKDRRPEHIKAKVEELKDLADKIKAEGMDEETKRSLDEMLGGIRKRAPLKAPRHYAPHTYEDAVKVAEIKRKEAARAEAEYRDRMEAEERERLLRMERARQEAAARVAERQRENKVRIMREWAELMASEREAAIYDLKYETANVSVQTSKACITVRCSITPAFADAMLSIKGVRLVDDIFECTPEAMKLVKPLLAKTFKDVQMVGVPKTLPSTKFDQLMHKLDRDDKQRIYKLLALKYHVDKGGSHETMVLINQVFKES